MSVIDVRLCIIIITINSRFRLFYLTVIQSIYKMYAQIEFPVLKDKNTYKCKSDSHTKSSEQYFFFAISNKTLLWPL